MNKRQRKKNDKRILEKIFDCVDIGKLHGVKRHRVFTKEHVKTVKRENWLTPFHPIPIEEQGGGLPWGD